MIHHFDRTHNDPTNCQLILAVTGTKNDIKKSLIKILKDLEENKPIQGIYINSSSSSTTEIVTPIWNGKKY